MDGDEWGDIDSEEEQAGSSLARDVLTTSKAYEICCSAVNGTGYILNNTDEKVLNVLRKYNMIEQLESGDIVLARDAILHGIMVSRPVLERDLRSSSTTLELQYDLRENGWEFSCDLQQGSVHDKVAVDDNPSTYYTLLTYYSEALVMYEEDESFHHKQSEQYYKTIEVALIWFPAEIIDVPTYKSAKYYQQLQAFLIDESGTVPDPRDDDEDQRRPRCWFVKPACNPTDLFGTYNFTCFFSIF